ncbi:PREDICTED: uncharacterized protein LOC105568601 [Vollenhovia emeryi]|uniref:uncharacterized protein LOC105568601 n=1 Tax=Vollenhovia emeryi TaxID=411798 RepID=UPI0005F43445|nr:PREDICTED: uncharacterized protein LOC105568601 [Vollenhovia emeryi]
MSTTVFAFAFVIACAAAEIPSYIHICGRQSSNIEKCILDNIINLKSKICKGIPELDIPSNDPFILDKVALADTQGIKLYVRNAQIRGFCDFKINSFHADINNLQYDIVIVFDQIRANTTYDFNLNVLIPISHMGQLYITADNVGAKINLQFKLVTKDGKRFTYLSKIKINIDIKKYNAEYGVEGEQFAQLREIIQNFVGQNQEEIINSLKPALEEIVSRRIISITNNIVKHFTYEELFPNRT